MADRGRDVVLRVVSDETKFDLSDVVDQLEDVSDASDDAAKDLESTTDELKRLAVQGQAAQKELDRLNAEAANNRFDELGQDAKAAARKVDAAFDAMAKDAKSSMHTVDKETGEAFGEVRDEAKANLSEVASSFQGDMTSAIDLVQGTLGGLVAGIPGIGGALAAAAAVGVGAIAAMWQKSQEAAEKAREAANDYYNALVEGRGRADQAAEVGKVLEDEENQLTKNIEVARKYGIASTDVVAALAGDAKARARVVSVLDAQLAAQEKATHGGRAAAPVVTKNIEGLNGLRDAITKAADAQVAGTSKYQLQQDTLEALGLTTDDHTRALENNTRAQQAAGLAAQDLADQQAAAQQAEDQRKAALGELQTAIENVGQAEITRKDGTIKSIDEIIKAQERELKAKADFEKNTKAVFAAVGQAGVDWALAQGPNAAAAMKLLADAPKAKQKEIAANYTAAGVQAGEGVAAGLTGSKPAVVSAVTNLHAAADAQLAALGKVGIAVGVDGAQVSAEAQKAWLDLNRYMQTHPITLPPLKPGGKRIVDNGS